VFFTDVRLPAENLVGEVNEGWALAKITLGNERVSLSGGGALWGRGPTAADLLDLVISSGGISDPAMRQRAAQLHIESEILRLMRLRSVSAAIKGQQPGPEVSVRKILADEHGQRIMGLYKDLSGAYGMLDGADAGSQSGVKDRPAGRWNEPAQWAHGYLFSIALTIGGGTGEIQRNIVAERVLDLPHEPDADAGRTWAEAQRVAQAR
jgi:alkylation response protein AidB-like acyl-CoA dehydrogenase